MSLTNDTCKNICNVGTTIGNVDYTLEQSMYFFYMSFGERLGLAHWGQGTVPIIFLFACSMPCCHLDQCVLLLIRILWTNSNEIIEMSYQKIHLKIWSHKWGTFCLSRSSINKVTNTLVSPAWEMFSYKLRKCHLHICHEFVINGYLYDFTNYFVLPFAMGLLPDAQNCGFFMRRKNRERFPATDFKGNR